jgi:hypothetical protein
MGRLTGAEKALVAFFLGVAILFAFMPSDGFHGALKSISGQSACPLVSSTLTQPIHPST